MVVVVVGGVSLAALPTRVPGRGVVLGPWSWAPQSPEPWVLAPRLWVEYAGWGLLRPGPSGGAGFLGSPWNGLHPSVENHDLLPSLLPPSRLPTSQNGRPLLFPLQQDVGLSDETSIWTCPVPYGHVQMSNIQFDHVPVPVPAPPVAICDPITGHVAGWTRPYSRLCYTRATLTALQGPNSTCWSLTRFRRGCFTIHPSALSICRSIIHLHYAFGPRWPGV